MVCEPPGRQAGEQYDRQPRLGEAPRRALPPSPRATILGGFDGLAERSDPADTRLAPVDDLIAAWARAPDVA